MQHETPNEQLAAVTERPALPCDRWARDEQHAPHEWTATVDGPAVCPGVSDLAAVIESDPWPEADADILTDGYARYGVALTDPARYVRDMREQQAVGLPYHRPTHGERAMTAMWDEVFRKRAARDELTGTILDREVRARLEQREIARIIAESEHLQARRRRTLRRLIIMWSAAVIGLALAGALAERGLNA